MNEFMEVCKPVVRACKMALLHGTQVCCMNRPLLKLGNRTVVIEPLRE